MKVDFRILRLLCFAVLLTVTNRASADLFIDLQSGVINPGGTLTLDVLISGTPTTEMLQDFTIILDAAPDSAAAGTRLEFIDPQSEAYLTNSDYVFFGNSDAALFPPATIVSSVNDTNDNFEAEDITANTLDELVGIDELLVQIDLQHVLDGVPAVLTGGDTFTITVDDTNSVFFTEAGFDVAFTNNQATVTVAATAIPEPGTIAAGLIAAAVFLPSVLRRRRRRSAN